MYYAILSEDVENSLPLRKQARPHHIERLESLKVQGRLMLAGPPSRVSSGRCLGDRGGVTVPEQAASLYDARSCIG